MTSVPSHPKIYHITHLRNVAQIVEAGKLWSDAKRIELGLNCDVVGMSHIKRRRLEEIEVDCHAGTHVGDYVPFYFCPRSIMLYILHMGNHPDLNYTEGQQPIVHFRADLNAVVEWAEAKGRRWAFSDRNAGTYIAQFYKRLEQLSEVNWAAVATNDFRDMVIKEGKQAEFLVHQSFPWRFVERVGVCDERIATTIREAIADADHRPNVAVEPSWYY
ncbi:MAG: hypothetical protein CHACPFDD_02210 [Phycisphaerae bacterium]|nr:hypothetical protein [Phycisphaerae bacterium]